MRELFAKGGGGEVVAVVVPSKALLWSVLIMVEATVVAILGAVIAIVRALED